MSKPAGTINVTVFVYQHPSRCKACGSTDRIKYSNRQVEECATTLGDGMPVTHIVRQNTACKDCGQRRIDTTYHYLPKGRTLSVKDEKKPSVASDIRDEVLDSLKPKVAELSL